VQPPSSNEVHLPLRLAMPTPVVNSPRPAGRTVESKQAAECAPLCQRCVNSATRPFSVVSRPHGCALCLDTDDTHVPAARFPVPHPRDHTMSLHAFDTAATSTDTAPQCYADCTDTARSSEPPATATYELTASGRNAVTSVHPPHGGRRSGYAPVARHCTGK
jgi:hypothetical protein